MLRRNFLVVCFGLIMVGLNSGVATQIATFVESVRFQSLDALDIDQAIELFISQMSMLYF